MKKTFLLVVAFMLVAFNIYAQIHFEPGYFINNQGDKTEALIKNLDWKNNPVAFDYKTTEAGETITAAIKDVQEFGVGQFIFKRYTVNLDRATNDVDYMSLHKEPDFTNETVFLKILLSGNLALYKYEDGNLIRFFYSKDNNVPEQLIYKPYREGTNILYNNSFRGQLYVLMSDKINDKDRYKETRYDEKSLVKLFTSYNGDSALPLKNIRGTGTKRFHLKITPGIDLNTAELHQTENNGKRYDFDMKPSFRMGIEAELVLPINNGKWAIFAEPYYTNYNQAKEDVYAIGGGTQVKNIMQIDYSYIAIPLGIRHYVFFNDNSSLFINAAYSYGFPVGNSKATFVYQGSYATTKSTADATNSSSFAFGAGYRYKRYSIEARYNSNRQLLANYAEWKSSISAISVILGYTIF